MNNNDKCIAQDFIPGIYDTNYQKGKRCLSYIFIWRPSWIFLRKEGVQETSYFLFFHKLLHYARFWVKCGIFGILLIIKIFFFKQILFYNFWSFFSASLKNEVSSMCDCIHLQIFRPTPKIQDDRQLNMQIRHSFFNFLFFVF